MALVTFSSVILALAAAIVTAVMPTPGRFWLTIGLGAFGIGMWFAEMIFTHTEIATTFNAPGDFPWHWLGAVLMWSLIGGLAFVVVTSYRLFVVGPEMEPLLREGRFLGVRMHVDPENLAPGKLILFRLDANNQRSEPGRLALGRIVAVPGDSLAIRNDRYFVNGEFGLPASQTGAHHVPIVIPAFPETIKVPPNCYFVTQDSPKHGLDSRVLSWARRAEIVSTQFVVLDSWRLQRPIEELNTESAAISSAN